MALPGSAGLTSTLDEIEDQKAVLTRLETDIASAKQNLKLKNDRKEDVAAVIEETAMTQRKMLKLQQEKKELMEAISNKEIKLQRQQERLCFQRGVAPS